MEELKDYAQPLEAGKERTGFPSRAYREECSHAGPFILAWGDPLQTSDLQSCQIIYLYCFKKLLRLWYSSNRKLIEESYVLARQKDKRKGLNLHFVYQALALMCTIPSPK